MVLSPDERSRQERQLREQRGRLLGRQHPFRPHGPKPWQIDVLSGVLGEMPPLHGRPEHGAQDVVNVIDRPGRVAFLHQVRHD